MTLSPFSLENKTILVTGASSGIGRASAIMASQMGARIIATGRDSSRLDECLSSLTGEGHVCIPIDLIDELAIKNFAIECSEIDGLVFAAGIAEVVPFKLISMRHIDRLIKLNFYSPSLLTSLLHKHKKLRPLASLVYISAISEHISPAGSAIYSASKAALNAFVRSIALELSKLRIRANTISPGYVNTPMLDKLSLTSSVQDMVKLSPLGLIQPEDIACSVIYLLSDASRWVTRSNLVVDGGLTIPIRR